MITRTLLGLSFLVNFGVSTVSQAEVRLSPQATLIVQRMQDAGAALTNDQIVEIAAQADVAREVETRSNALYEASGLSTANRVLLCAKVKSGFVGKVEGGLCSDLTGQLFWLNGSGAVATGIAATVMTLIYVGRLDIPVGGDYQGVGGANGVRKAAMYALKFAKLIKAMPKAVGPDVALYSDGLHGGLMLQLGIQMGPMIDIGYSRMTLAPL